MRSEKPKENIHAGHRERLREMIDKKGVKDMPEHEVLEYILFFALPRIDTNPLAHRLINRFGSLTAVLDAKIEDLVSVQGVGLSTARFLKLFSMISEMYAREKMKSVKGPVSIKDAAAFLTAYYVNKTSEEVFAMYLDNGGRLIFHDVFSVGSLSMASIDLRQLVKKCLEINAASLILAHNHPGGSAKPSNADIELTRTLMSMFRPLNMELKAHLIVANDEYTDIVAELNGRTAPVRYISVRAFDGLPANDADIDLLYEKYGVEKSGKTEIEAHRPAPKTSRRTRRS